MEKEEIEKRMKALGLEKIEGYVLEEELEEDFPSVWYAEPTIKKVEAWSDNDEVAVMANRAEMFLKYDKKK